MGKDISLTKYGCTNGVNDKGSPLSRDERDASLGPLPSNPSQSCDRILARTHCYCWRSCPLGVSAYFKF